MNARSISSEHVLQQPSPALGCAGSLSVGVWREQLQLIARSRWRRMRGGVEARRGHHFRAQRGMA